MRTHSPKLKSSERNSDIMDAATLLLALYVLINVFVFITFGMDKSKSKLGWWRVSESTLVVFSLFGAFGGLLGMHVFHHKVSKLKFKLVYLFVVIHVIVIAMFATGYIKLPSF